MDEVKRFVETLYKVVFCFVLGDAFLIIISYTIDFIIDGEIISYLTTSSSGYIIQGVAGLISMTWVIRDGEFIDDIKSSHWSQKDNPNH